MMLMESEILFFGGKKFDEMVQAGSPGNGRLVQGMC